MNVNFTADGTQTFNLGLFSIFKSPLISLRDDKSLNAILPLYLSKEFEFETDNVLEYTMALNYD
jgi:hypothetical protein